MSARPGRPLSGRSALRKLRALAFFKTGLTLQGSKLAAANNIDIAAGNDVLLGAIENLSGHEKYFKGGHDIEVNRTYDVVSLDAGNNLSIRAGNNIESEGAQFSAGNIASLIAENEMNLLAVVESHYDADKTTKKSTFSKRVTETVSLHEEVQGTVINAGTILLNAEVGEEGQVVKAAAGDITLVGGELNADNDIIAFGNDITITAGTYQDYEYSHTSKSSFGGLKSKSKEDLAQDVLLSGSTVSAGGTVRLESEGNIAIISSDLKGQDIGLKAFDEILIASGEESRIRESRSQSGGFLSGGSLYSASEAVNGTIKTTANSASVEAKGNLIIEAGSATVIGSTLDADGGIKVKTDIGDIQILAAKETEHSYEYRKELNVGLGDMLKVLSDPAGLLKDTYERSKESGRISVTIANADYLESETTTDITRHKGSEVTAGKGITFDSVGNINIEGGYVDADKDGDDEGALRLKAGGNIRVADVTDTFSQSSKTTSGSAQVNAMVTHQAAEVANAAIAVKDATDQLEKTRRNYKAWEQQQDTLKQQLAKLESELAQGKPGVTQADIDDLRTQIDILSTDEAWHLANISVATYNLATATENLYLQSVAAYNSGATYGFNAGMELNLNAQVTESQVQESYSVGSYLSGAGVSFETGEDGTLDIAGSWVDSSKDMTLDVGNLVMSAGKNTHDSQTQSKQGNLNISQTVWGAAAGGPAIRGSLNLSEERNHTTTYTNAGLTADGKMTMNVKGDAELIGATVHADEGLSATIDGDLTVTSVQDIAYGSNKGIGVSGGVSFGGKYTNEGGAKADNKTTIKTTALGETTGAQSANGGISLENGRYFSKETVLSGITSGGVTDITVGGHTALNGALIANVDENGQDTGQLTLNTKGLSFTDLTNTYYSSNSSLSLNTNVMLGDTPVPAKPELTGVTYQPKDSKGENQPSGTTNVGIHQDSSYGKGKTLATIGNGTIIVGGEETEPEGLNRDVDAVDKELYSIERTKGDLDLTVQNKTLGQIADAIADSTTYVTDALGLTGLSKEERQQLLAEFSAAFDGGLDGINANDAAKKTEQIAQFATELDSIIENAGVKSLEDDQFKPGALTVYADEIRGVVMASQADGVDPLAAIIALEKLKSDINSISSQDISNPERKAEAAYIITQMQEDILNKIPLSDALGMVGWAAAGRKIVIDAGKQVIKEGIGAAGDAYQGIKQYLKKDGDGAGQTASKKADELNGGVVDAEVGHSNLHNIPDVQKNRLLDVLEGNGVKYTAEDILDIRKLEDGRVVFLEKGNSKAGLEHIILEHAEHFNSRGISQSQIPDAVMAAVTQGKVVGYQGKGTGRPIYEVEFNGKLQKIAVTISDNGYIVGANPAK